MGPRVSWTSLQLPPHSVQIWVVLSAMGLVVEVKRHDVGGYLTSIKGATSSSGSSPHLLLLWVSSYATFVFRAAESQHQAGQMEKMLPYHAFHHQEHAVCWKPSRWEGCLPGNRACLLLGEGLLQKASQHFQDNWLPSSSLG